MRLNTPLVTSFVYEEEELQIDLSFDTVLDVFDVLDDKSLRDYEKADICLALLLDESLEMKESIDLWNHIYKNFIEFKRGQTIEYDLKGNPMPVKDDDDDDERIMDFGQDAEYIYSSFMSTYQMDLFEMQGKLHWHKFRSLLEGLDPNSKYMRVLGIRQVELPSGKGTEKERERIKKMKDIYALKD